MVISSAFYFSAQESAEENRPVIKKYRPPLAVDFNPVAWRLADISDITAGYAYALNRPDIGEALPGFLMLKPCMDGTKGMFPTRLPTSPDEMGQRMQEDDLHYDRDRMPARGHALCFFRNPASGEILYLRRDSNNLWSYREITEHVGCRRPHIPRQCDFSGKPIRHPERANLGSFTQFLGYACIPYEGIIYFRRIVLPDEVMKPFFRCIPAEVTLSRDYS